MLSSGINPSYFAVLITLPSQESWTKLFMTVSSSCSHSPGVTEYLLIPPNPWRRLLFLNR